LACYGQRRALHWLTPLVLVLAFVTYFLKYWLAPPDPGPQFLSYRLVNRAMVAGMLWLLSRVLGMWLEAENFRHDPLWSDEFDRAHTQISALLGMLIAMPMVVVIALVDALTPGNFNLSVLYTVPLVTCAWVRSERLMWALFALLQFLAIGGLYWGPPPILPHSLSNRILNGVMMLVVAGVLHYWIRAMRRSDQGGPGETSAGAESPGGDDEHLVAR
jgi:hypothetical protein